MKKALGQPLNSEVGTFPVPIIVSDTMRTSSTDPTLATVSVAGHGTAHTKGSWVEIIASTAAEAKWIGLLVYNTSSAGTAGGALMDIAIGAGGSEVIIVPNLSVSNSPASASFPQGVMLPVHVPKGSRIAVRWQCARASPSSAAVGITLYGWPPGWSGLRSPTSLDNINANTTTTAGTSAGATSNEWVEVSASATRSYQGFVATPLSNDIGMSASKTQIDVGVGASGAERWMTIPEMWEVTSSEAYQPHPWTLNTSYVPLRCPKGARIAIRVRDGQAGGMSTNSPQVVILGVPYA